MLIKYFLFWFDWLVKKCWFRFLSDFCASINVIYKSKLFWRYQASQSPSSCNSWGSSVACVSGSVFCKVSKVLSIRAWKSIDNLIGVSDEWKRKKIPHRLLSPHHCYLLSLSLQLIRWSWLYLKFLHLIWHLIPRWQSLLETNQHHLILLLSTS